MSQLRKYIKSVKYYSDTERCSGNLFLESQFSAALLLHIINLNFSFLQFLSNQIVYFFALSHITHSNNFNNLFVNLQPCVPINIYAMLVCI